MGNSAYIPVVVVAPVVLHAVVIPTLETPLAVAVDVTVAVALDAGGLAVAAVVAAETGHATVGCRKMH